MAEKGEPAMAVPETSTRTRYVPGLEREYTNRHDSGTSADKRARVRT